MAKIDKPTKASRIQEEERRTVMTKTNKFFAGALALVAGMAMSAGGALAQSGGYTIGDAASTKLIPYFDTGMNRATIIGIQNMSAQEAPTIERNEAVRTVEARLAELRAMPEGMLQAIADLETGLETLQANTYSEGLFVDVTAYDAAGMVVGETGLCLEEHEFGFVVLQGPAAPGQGSRQGRVLSVADGDITENGYVMVETSVERYKSCNPPPGRPGGFVQVDGVSASNDIDVDGTTMVTNGTGDGVGVAAEPSRVATWAIIQDVGEGFFGTEVPTSTINLFSDTHNDAGLANCYDANEDGTLEPFNSCGGLIPERGDYAADSETDPSTVYARYDTLDDSEIYVWLARTDGSTLASRERMLNIVVECEDGTEIRNADIDGVGENIMVPAPNHLTIINPASGILEEFTAQCEGGTRGTLRIYMPGPDLDATGELITGGDPNGSHAGMVFTHISQLGGNFRMNFPGYSITPATLVNP